MSRRERVLVLDVDQTILIKVEQLLEDRGFDTTTTWEYREALHLLKERQYDLVLVGHHPPDIDAGDLLKRLQVMHSKAACFVLRATPPLTTHTPLLQRHKYGKLVRTIREHLPIRRRTSAA